MTTTTNNNNINKFFATTTIRNNRKMSTTYNNNKLIWIDCEMTGLNINVDRLLEVAVVITDQELKIIEQLDSLYIGTARSVLDAMSDWHQHHFTSNGLIEKCAQSNMTVEQIDDQLASLMVKHCIATKNGILAGNSIGYDRRFLDKYCPKFTAHLHYRMVDVSTIKLLVNMWYGDKTLFKKQTQHRALNDIMQSIDELRYYREKYFKL